MGGLGHVACCPFVTRINDECCSRHGSLSGGFLIACWVLDEGRRTNYLVSAVCVKPGLEAFVSVSVVSVS